MVQVYAGVRVARPRLWRLSPPAVMFLRRTEIAGADEENFAQIIGSAGGVADTRELVNTTSTPRCTQILFDRTVLTAASTRHEDPQCTRIADGL